MHAPKPQGTKVAKYANYQSTSDQPLIEESQNMHDSDHALGCKK
jgi:hypothetical protein